MTETGRGWLVVVVLVVGLAVSFQFGLRPYFKEHRALQNVLQANSTWTITMQQYDLRGAISSETYRLHNDNGKVTMFYSATNREGTCTKQLPNVPLQGPQGTFLFELLRSEGIWELDDKPLRPNPRDEYVVEVEQTLGDEGGQHAFSFSDPVYWAFTRAREYHFRLPAKGRISQLNVRSAADVGGPLRDPRYLKIVQMIQQFGPGGVLQAESTIRQELAQTNSPAGLRSACR